MNNVPKVIALLAANACVGENYQEPTEEERGRIQATFEDAQFYRPIYLDLLQQSDLTLERVQGDGVTRDRAEAQEAAQFVFEQARSYYEEERVLVADVIYYTDFHGEEGTAFGIAPSKGTEANEIVVFSREFEEQWTDDLLLHEVAHNALNDRHKDSIRKVRDSADIWEHDPEFIREVIAGSDSAYVFTVLGMQKIMVCKRFKSAADFHMENVERYAEMSEEEQVAILLDHIERGVGSYSGLTDEAAQRMREAMGISEEEFHGIEGRYADTLSDHYIEQVLEHRRRYISERDTEVRAEQQREIVQRPTEMQSGLPRR
jgi:hypothetical protein